MVVGGDGSVFVVFRREFTSGQAVSVRSICCKRLKVVITILPISLSSALALQTFGHPTPGLHGLLQKEHFIRGLLRNVSATVWLKSALGEETDQSLLLWGCLGRLKPSWVASVKGSQVLQTVPLFSV